MVTRRYRGLQTQQAPPAQIAQWARSSGGFRVQVWGHSPLLSSVVNALRHSKLGYMLLKRGPSPPSGGTHQMLTYGHFTVQVMQCRQLEGLSTISLLVQR